MITFIKKIENLDYIDAVRFLADRAGLKMPEDKADDAVSRLRMRVLEANRDAARFFHAALYSPAGPRRAGLLLQPRLHRQHHPAFRAGLRAGRAFITCSIICGRRDTGTMSSPPPFWRTGAGTNPAICTTFSATG